MTINKFGMKKIDSFEEFLKKKKQEEEIMIVEPKWNEWKLAIKTPKFQNWDLTEESFKEAFQEVINGQ